MIPGLQAASAPMATNPQAHPRSALPAIVQWVPWGVS